MEGFNKLEEPNSTKATRVVMVEVEHNKGAYREWYKINEKKTHIRGFSIVEITKEFKCNSKNNSKLKLLKMCVIKGDATKSTDAYVKQV